MLTPEEYERYHSFKALGEFGREMTPAEFKERRKAKFRGWLPAVLAPYPRICDYGAGTGWLAELCAEHGHTCTSVDDIGGGTRFADVEPVDLVTAICVLEHMTPAEVIQFTRTAAAKAAALFIVTNNPFCLFSHFVLWDDITHVRLYSEHAIHALLCAQGWTIERVFYEDDMRTAFGLTGERLAEFQRLMAVLGPVVPDSPYNYWCMLARSPQAPAA